MPADSPINLNRARKARAKADAKTRADANAAKYGRSKAERLGETARSSVERLRLDGHRIDDDHENR